MVTETVLPLIYSFKTLKYIELSSSENKNNFPQF